jgi:hypothetical protein
MAAKTIEERLERLEQLVPAVDTSAVPGLRQHLMDLYRLEDGTLGVVEGEGHAFDDPGILRACVEAVCHARAGNKGECVTIPHPGSPAHGSIRAACEVVAYYELEEFVTAA